MGCLQTMKEQNEKSGRCPSLPPSTTFSSPIWSNPKTEVVSGIKFLYNSPSKSFQT